MNKKYHYVYRITNTKLNKHYYGVRSSNVEPSKDLGFKYFSSSSDVQFIEDQKNNPQDYKYIIVSIFNTRHDALELEIKLHAKFNVGVNESFYNKAKATSTSFDKTGIKVSEESKNKMRGRKVSQETRRKMGEAKRNRIVSEETRRKIGEANRNRIVSEETRKKISINSSNISDETREKMRQAHLGNTYCLGNKLSEETKAKIKKAQQDFDYHPSEEFKEYLREVNTGVKVYHDPNTKKNRRFKNIKDVPAGWVKGESHTKTAECPHCNKIGNKAAMHRWHFDNCKKKQ